MQKKTETVASQLYDAITEAVEAGWSLNQIAIQAGVQQSNLSSWYSGKRESLALQTVCALCDHFGMRLTKPKIGAPAEIRKPGRKPKAKAAPKRKRAKPTKKGAK